MTARSSRSMVLRRPSHSSHVPAFGPPRWRPGWPRLPGSAAARSPPSVERCRRSRSRPSPVPETPSHTVQSASPRRVLHHAFRRAGDTDQVAAGELVDLAGLHRGRVVGPAGDEPGRGQVEHRVQLVAEAHVERGRWSRSARIASLPATPPGRISEKTKQPARPVMSTSAPDEHRARSGCAAGRRASGCRAARRRMRCAA